MKRLIAGSAVVGGLFAATARGQAPVPVPIAPAAPAVPAAPTVPGVAAPAAAPAPRNIWSFFCLTPEQKAAHAAKKAKFCQSPLGQLLTNMTKPLGAMTGGIIGGCCPPDATTANPADLAKPPTDAEGAAARIKKVEAESAARRAAVRYLGTVNCKRFPEAEAALVSALRTDPIECVRFEAALALTRGCCCTAKTIKALTETVNGGTADNNPAETSPRVRATAAQALARCCSRTETPTTPEPPAELPPPERPPAAAGPGDEPPRAVLLADARRALAQYQAEGGSRPHLVTGQRSLADAYKTVDPPLHTALFQDPFSPPPAANDPRFAAQDHVRNMLDVIRERIAVPPDPARLTQPAAPPEPERTAAPLTISQAVAAAKNPGAATPAAGRGDPPAPAAILPVAAPGRVMDSPAAAPPPGTAPLPPTGQRSLLQILKASVSRR